jgi:DNA-binding response OmpR family regulator
VRALVIDDNRGWRDVLCQELETANIKAEASTSWSEALTKLKDSRLYNLVILDLFEAEEPHPSGLRFLRQMRSSGINVPVIVVTGEASRRNSNIIRDLFHEYRIFDYFEKTQFPGEEFLKSVRMVQEESDPALGSVQRICSRFHLVASELGYKRHDARETLTIQDEYDVQDLLRSMLRLYFDDIRPEEWTPSYAGGSSRVDFLLKAHKIVIEVKKTRKNLRQKEAAEQLIIDAEKYTKLQDCRALVCLVYDPDHYIQNVAGFESDLAHLSKGELRVIPIVVPRA